MTLRFTKGGAYLADIQTIRNQVRANGTRTNIQAIQLSHPQAPNDVLNVYVNLAYQPNSNGPGINGKREFNRT